MDNKEMSGLLKDMIPYHFPTKCEKCDGVLIFRGVGSYKCEDCGHIEYDDYGKVRNYIETHGSNNISQIEQATGVSIKVIHQMVKEQRFSVAANSITFLRCEICGESIHTGRLCSKCEAEYHRKVEDMQRADRPSRNVQGYGKVQGEASGAKRFTR